MLRTDWPIFRSPLFFLFPLVALVCLVTFLLGAVLVRSARKGGKVPFVAGLLHVFPRCVCPLSLPFLAGVFGGELGLLLGGGFGRTIGELVGCFLGPLLGNPFWISP